MAWAEIVPKLREAAKRERGTQKRLALRFDLRDDEVTRIMKGTQVPDPVLGNSLVKELLGLSLSQLLGEAPREVHETIQIGEDEAIGVPLIARDVAAGHGSFPQPVEARRYFFRADSLRDMIGPGSSRKDRLGVVFLDPRQRFGESMMPTIQPGSMILVDRQVSKIEDRMIYLVEYNDLGEEGALAIKRLTLDSKKRILICESDNPDQAYAPVIIDLQEEGLRWEHVVKGRVILWSTESKPRTPPMRKKRP